MNSDAPEEGNAFWAQKSALEQVCPSSSRQLQAHLTIRMHTTLLVCVVQLSSGRTPTYRKDRLQSRKRELGKQMLPRADQDVGAIIRLNVAR